MSSENVEVVRRAYTAINSGDFESDGELGEILDPEFEWHGTVGGLSEGQISRGVEQAQEYWNEDSEAWESVRFEPSEFIDLGERVLVLQREYRKGRQSGIETSVATGALFTLRGGKVVRFDGYMDQAEARAAAGV